MNLTDERTAVTPSDSPPPAEGMSPDRRATLKKLGALAVWTPPVMLTLTLSQRASAESCGPEPLPPCPPT